PNDAKPTTRLPISATSGPRLVGSAIRGFQLSDHASAVKDASQSASRCPAYADCQPRTCTLAIAYASSGPASRMVISMAFPKEEAGQNDRPLFYHVTR